MIDIGNDSSDEDEEGPVKKKQATEGGEEGVSTPPLTLTSSGTATMGFTSRRR